MEELLSNINITSHMLYLSLILVVIGNGLKQTIYIANWSILWILMTISIIINFVFFGIRFETLFEAVVAVALSTVIYQFYKQTNEGVRDYRQNSKKLDRK